MGKMNEISIINDYDNIQLMMCEKEDLIQHINYLQGQLQGSQDEVEELKEEIETLKEMRVDDKIYNEEQLEIKRLENEKLKKENNRLNRLLDKLGYT